MANFFGTDGIRGEYGKTLTCELAFSVGNALAQIRTAPNILIGHDTRCSADALMLSLCAGIIQGGGNVVSVGTVPTPAISFLTESEKFDYGIMVTASHNPPIFNGIKIFGSNGRKISDSEEDFLEEFFKINYVCECCGNFCEKLSLQQKYFQHLKNSTDQKLNGLHVCVDASNGAGFKIAPKVFRTLGTKLSTTACTKNGEKINSGCGCLHIENLIKKMKQTKADIGFAYDGDADRVLCVSKEGNVFDGDKLLYILAKNMKEKGELFANSVVGTSHTNSGIMVALNRNKINLIRTDIGDKYVLEAMEKMNLRLGGEQSGHIIIKTHAQTGDGILTSIKICEILQKSGKTLEELFDAKLIPQCNINLDVKDKIKILNNEGLKNLINKIANEIAPAGRVLMRASGTEDKVRIMIEHPSLDEATAYANQIKDMILQI